MFKKNTGELEEELRSVHPADAGDYLRNHSEDLVENRQEFGTYMKERMKEKGLQMQEVFLQADIPQRYGYKLLSGEKRTRQRDVILRICYAARLSLQETQRALRLYRMDGLYARDPRDAILMICFNQRPGSVSDVNELLEKNGMEQLRPSGKQE